MDEDHSSYRRYDGDGRRYLKLGRGGNTKREEQLIKGRKREKWGSGKGLSVCLGATCLEKKESRADQEGERRVYVAHRITRKTASIKWKKERKWAPYKENVGRKKLETRRQEQYSTGRSRGSL